MVIIPKLFSCYIISFSGSARDYTCNLYQDTTINNFGYAQVAKSIIVQGLLYY